MPNLPETERLSATTEHLHETVRDLPPQENLSGSALPWRQALECLALGVAVLDAASSRVLWVNSALMQLLTEGLGVGDVRGQRPPDFLAPMDRADWEAALTALPRPSAAHRLKLVHNSTRQIAYWEWSLQALDAPATSHLLLTVQNVSDAVLKEKQLVAAGRAANRSRQRAEALTSLTANVNASLTPRDMLHTITRQAAAYFDAEHAAVLLLCPDGECLEIGYSMGLKEPSSSQNGVLRRSNTLTGQAMAQRQTLVLSDAAASAALQIPLLNNGARPAAIVTSPIWQNERIYGAVEVYFERPRDIPQDARTLLAAFADQTAIALQKADLYTQITEQRRQLQSIFDNAPVGIVYFDPQGRALAVNASAAAKLGRSPSDLLGRKLGDFLTGMPPNLLESVREGSPFHASHFVYRLPDGEEIVCDVSLLPVRDERAQVVGILQLTYDVTELVQARQEADQARQAAEQLLAQIQTTQGQMIQLEKMRAIGELASGVAHDFNNALMAILGYTELAEESLEEPDQLAMHLAIIRKAAEDATTTVKRLQNFAKQRTVPHGQLTDVATIVQDVVEMTRPQWRDAAQKEGRTYTIQFDIQPLPLILAEPSGLREVLINIIYNALNAMPRGGRLTIATRESGSDHVEIRIADTGKGMSPEVRSRIFDPFYTTRGVEGNGLGLAVSWAIIQRHGGTIEVESIEGEGSTFIVRLPVRQGESSPARLKPLPIPAPNPGTSLLVVDDEPFVASVVATILSRNGYHVTIAHSAQEALERLWETPDAFQLLLTDHGMPGMSGLQLTAESKRHWPCMPILLLTGWGESLLQTHIAETLPDAVLGKPINQSDLLDAVARTLRENVKAH